MPFSLTILGSSSALPTSERFPTAQLLNANERFFLIDCGEGTQIQLRRNRIKLGKIHHILISHLHGDHTYGLYGLLSSFNLLGREYPLNIYANPLLEGILNQHFSDFDLHLGYELVFHPLDCSRSERIYEDDRLYIETIPLKHRVPTCGFLFGEKVKSLNIRKAMAERYNLSVKEIQQVKLGEDYTLPDGRVIPNQELTFRKEQPKRYAYCTDTAYTEEYLGKIKGIDLLYHEATYAEDMKGRARETFHSTATEAATLAKKAGVKKLLLGHFSARYKELDQIRDEAARIFREVELAIDNMKVEI